MSTSKRLPGVDGLRAVAALWVVFFHITAFSQAQFPQVPGLDLFLRSGSTGVSLFLVLSGFCLFLPFAGGRTHRFKPGQFFVRRARRLMPAYYVAVAASFVVAVATTGFQHLPNMTLSDAAWQVATHLTLTHTLFPDTFYSLNGAFWSLGLEWQLYLALPLLIWITARYGLARAAALAISVNVVYRLGLDVAMGAGVLEKSSILASSVLANQLPGRWAEFAFGMVAADLYARGHIERYQRFVPVLIALMIALVPVSLVASRFELSHLAYGALFVTLLCIVIANDNPIARFLAWRPLVALGTMSYSLYLVHQPIIQSLADALRLGRPDLSSGAIFAIIVVAVLPIVGFVAWVLFETVERRTIGTTSHYSSGAKTVGASTGTVADGGQSPASFATSPAFPITTVPAAAQGTSFSHN